MVEILKQGQYVPLPVEDQILIIFAGIGGFLDDLTSEAVARFESGLVRYIKEKRADLYRQLAAGKIEAQLKDALTAAVGEFKGTFK